MTLPIKDDLRNIRKAKTAAKVLVIGALCAFVLYRCYRPEPDPLAPKPLQAIELHFEQFVPPEPQPLPPPVQEPEAKKLLAEDSEVKVAPDPEPAVEEKPIEPPPPPEPEVKPKEPEPAPPKEEPLPKPEPPKKPEPPQKEKLKPTRKPKVKEQKPAETKSVKAPTAMQSSETGVQNAPSDNVGAKLKAKNALASLLVSWIEKKKRYPKAAKRSGMEGVTEVVFSFDPSGKVLSAAIVKPSGKGPLDSECRSLADRLIGMNFNVPNPGMNIVVPIRFKLEN